MEPLSEPDTNTHNRWATSGSDIERSSLVATKTAGDGWQLATGVELMTEGRHYWELEVRSCAQGCVIFFGAVRPGLDHEQAHHNTNDAYFINGHRGGLFGNGKLSAGERGTFFGDGDAGIGIGNAVKKGDCIGCLLDLDAGWLRFYRNGARCGQVFMEGVTGPLVRAVQLIHEGDTVAVRPGAEAPVNIDEGDAPTNSLSLAQLNAACKRQGLEVGGTKAALRARLEAERAAADADDANQAAADGGRALKRMRTADAQSVVKACDSSRMESMLSRLSKRERGYLLSRLGEEEEIGLTIASADGASFALRMPSQSLIREVKKAIEKRGITASFDLFIDGKEDALPGTGRLGELGIKGATTLFMMIKLMQEGECVL
jgi:hypothetical protein